MVPNKVGKCFLLGVLFPFLTDQVKGSSNYVKMLISESAHFPLRTAVLLHIGNKQVISMF